MDVFIDGYIDQRRTAKEVSLESGNKFDALRRYPGVIKLASIREQLSRS